MNYESTIDSSNMGLAGTDVDGNSSARTKWIVAGVIVAAALLALIVYGYFSSGEKAAADEAAAAAAGQAPVVTVAIPGTSAVERIINATGTLAARREIPVGVVGEGGRVTKVYVDAGDWVRAGQVMASIDRSVQNQQAASLRASIAVSRADLDLAQANLNRSMKLVERGFISQADIDRLNATRDAAAARLRVSEAQLGEAQARVQRLSIVAPVGGFILSRSVEPGQTVTQGSGNLFTLAQNGEMELRAQLSEDDLALVSPGTSVEVSPVGAAKIFNGQIWQISPTIDAQSRQGIARVALGYDRALRPGGFASATIRSGSSEAAVLPESAVLNDTQGSYVYIVGKENKVERRSIEVGAISSAGVSVTSGLSGTEKVVLRAGGFLNPGETVKPELQKKSVEG